MCEKIKSGPISWEKILPLILSIFNVQQKVFLSEIFIYFTIYEMIVSMIKTDIIIVFKNQDVEHLHLNDQIAITFNCLRCKRKRLHFAWVYILPSGDVAELIFDWIHGSQLKGNRKPGWAVNKEDFHKQIGNYCKEKWRRDGEN